MIRLLSFSLLLTLLIPAAHAGCYGSSSYYSCSDASGNSYNVQKYGNSTNTQGYNAGTGSAWSQNSQTIGGTTYQRGTDSDGNSWNQTIRKSGGSTTYSGTDSDGNSYYKTCNKFGCY